MSLHLDTRQRAMLQEMGLRVWSPTPVPAHAAQVAPAQPAPQTTRPTAPRTIPVTAAPVVTAPPGALMAWELQAPQPVYPHAGEQTATTEASPRWLLVAEGVTGADPLADDAGGLLDNMLHALRLRQQPQVFICVLAPLAGDATDSATTPDTPSQAFAQAIADVQPAVLLVMGRAAARSVLGRSEPLGQLRSQSHSVAGIPAVVTYDAAYLLRAPAAKAGAWDDLCRARALALPNSAKPVNS